MEPNVERIKLKGAEAMVKEGQLDEELLKKIQVRVVDYYHTFGAFIDRDKNRRLGIEKSDLHSRENFGYYLMDPDVPPCELPDKLTQNIQLLIEVRTKLKLDLVDKQGRGLLETRLGSDSDDSEEVHYILVENVMEEYQLGWRLLLKPFLNLFKLNKQLQACLLLHTLKDGWVITDFDGCLNGNPLEQQ